MHTTTNEDALQILERMTDGEFQDFLFRCPPRVQLLIRGGMVDWKKVLPEYLILMLSK